MSKNQQSSFADSVGKASISEKSKKNEILEAYQELLSKIEEGKQTSHQEVKKKQDEEAVVIKASEFKVDKIVTNIAEVKLSIGKVLIIWSSDL